MLKSANLAETRNDFSIQVKILKIQIGTSLIKSI